MGHALRLACVRTAERPLHHHHIEPAAVFESDRSQRADALEAGCGMECDRCGIGGVANESDHLPKAMRLGVGEQFPHQQAADSLPLELRIEIDRILNGPAIGRAKMIRAGIGVTRDSAQPLGHRYG